MGGGDICLDAPQVGISNSGAVRAVEMRESQSCGYTLVRC